MSNSFRCDFTVGRKQGAIPSEHRYYVLVMFDISDRKKYALLTKLLRKYGTRIQKSVYEAHLKLAAVHEMTNRIERLMESRFDPNDTVRIYRLSGPCSVTVFGDDNTDNLEYQENCFL